MQREKEMWQTPQTLQQLLCKVVSWESRTGTQGEIDFSYKIKEELMKLTYFKHQPDYIQFVDAGKQRNTVTALYKHPQATRTIVLISHFDTVHTAEFGDLGDLAFQPESLTAAFKENDVALPQDAKIDLYTDEYLFGRGTMDMKMGLCLHMQLLEKAILHNWPINLLLVTVPDEEVNSAGMRAAATALNQLRDQWQLHYDLFLNSEPSFSQVPQDDNYYIYSGTIGKIMPAALFYGRETHAGEPLNGLTGHYMASYLTKAMEFNACFEESAFGEKTPRPICLQQKDLKVDYSAQTSHHSAALYNVFLFEQNAAQVMATFKEIATEAMAACQRDYENICKATNVTPIGTIRVMTYDALLQYANETLGEKKVQMIKNTGLNNTNDERDQAIQICDQLLLHCSELAPATILFFAPPYYPAVNSSENTFIQEKVALAKATLADTYKVTAKQIHYFNGICDLSYVNYDANDQGWHVYQQNTPVWGESYDIPFTDMQQLQAPVLNIGPFGKDAHKISERLHKKSAFIYTPHVLETVIKSMF